MFQNELNGFGSTNEKLSLGGNAGRGLYSTANGLAGRG
jgi:hypothetical protein